MTHVRAYRNPESTALALGDLLSDALLVLLEDHGLVVHARCRAVHLLQLSICVPCILAAAAAAGGLLLPRLRQRDQEVLLLQDKALLSVLVTSPGCLCRHGRLHAMSDADFWQ